MSSGLILAPVADPTRKRIFEALVLDGIERGLVHMNSNERVIHALPLPRDSDIAAEGDISGGFVLFYSGQNQYSWAAKIQRYEQDGSEVADLLDNVNVESSVKQEYGDQYLVLDTPFRIDLDSYELHEAVEVDQAALTRFIHLSADRLSPVIADYQSLDEYVIDHRVEPTIWLEKTELEGRPYKQQGGQYEIGTAVFSKSESRDGRQIYETLREAEVGDIVLHLLQDISEITGISIVTSTLDEEFEGPPDDSWPDDARGEGYFRALARYQPLSDPIDIYDDLLDEQTYQSKLQTIYDAYDGLFYDRNRELNEGAYFTRCPIELIYLFIAESPELVDKFRDRYYVIPLPDPADRYSSVNETVTDIRIRLAFRNEGTDWFRDQLATTVVASVTETLKKVQPDAELTQKQAIHCELIAKTYASIEDQLDRIADDLGIGHANQVSPSRALFFVLFRDLQGWAGTSANMTHEKIRTILNENYTVKTPRPKLVDPDKIEPLSEPSKPRDADDIARQLLDTGQMVFYGPPGTGKTYVAQQFAKWWLHQQPDIEPDTSHLTTVTFHPSFTYEDFLEGLSAEVTEENTVAYDHTPGVFKEIADRARIAYQETPADEQPPKYVLIIDEINRGNLAQIFGETMTALEYDKRLEQPNETVVSLAHTGTPFSIPPNLYLIGTMNTADRSIALVDTALRRRFRFLAFPPDFEALYSSNSFAFDSQEEVETTIGHAGNGFERLLALSILAVQHFNREIIDAADLGKGKQIGHSYFFGVETVEDLVDIWRFEILPLLEEYFFGQFERIQEELFDGEGKALLDSETEQIKIFDEDDLERELTTLHASIRATES